MNAIYRKAAVPAIINPADNELVLSLIKPIHGGITAPPINAVQRIPAIDPSFLLLKELIASEKMHGKIIEVKNPTNTNAIADILAEDARTAIKSEI